MQTLKIINNLQRKDKNTAIEFIFTLLTMWLTIFQVKRDFSFRIKIKI